MQNTSHNPQCIGFILDGNRRYAKAQRLPTIEGHRRGLATLLDIIGGIHARSIAHMACYVFSTENWNRSPEEVTSLMRLFLKGFSGLHKELQKRGLSEKVALRFLGERTSFSKEIQTQIDALEAHNPQSPALTVWLLVSYGGRREIVAGVNAAIADGTSVNEASFAKLLWTSNMPDPDLIIRTGGDHRLSNFLTWSSVYSELFFSDTLWPAFTLAELDQILENYHTRNRRLGK